MTTKVAQHRILEGILQSEKKKDNHNEEITGRKINAATFIIHKSKKNLKHKTINKMAGNNTRLSIETLKFSVSIHTLKNTD